MLSVIENDKALLSPAMLERAPTRDQIISLERAMLAMPQIEIPVTHHFCNGIYAREISIPAGALLTGKIHKEGHLNVVSKGRILVWTEQGMREICSPYTFVSQPGTKRVGYALEDTVWTTIHGVSTDTQDLAVLESELIAPDFYALKESKKCLG